MSRLSFVLALIFACAILVLPAGDAFAAVYVDQGQAYAGCIVNAGRANSNPNIGSQFKPLVCDKSGALAYCVARKGGNGCVGSSSEYGYDANHTFPANTECSTRVDGSPGMINGTLYSGGVCDKGCKVQPNLERDTDFSLREQGGNAISIRRGTWKPTGEVCALDGNPKPERKDEFCHTTSSGHTVCKSKDQTCVSTASGFRTCAPDQGNTGKTQVNKGRTEGISISAPDTAPNPPANRPGEKWQGSGGNTSITNNITNNTTNTGGFNNSGTPNTGAPVPGDGSSPGGGSGGGGDGDGNGEGEGEGEGDSASDSGNCTAAPQCTGDTLKCLQLTYTWKVQCNTKGAEVTGGEGCTDADVPVCAGSTCKAETYASLLQQWRQRCAAKNMADGMSDRAGKISNPDDDGVVDNIWIKEVAGSGPKLRQDLVSVGGGGSLLPSISLEGRTWEPPPQFYDAIAGIRFLVIAMCTVMAMYIVGRNM